MHAFIIIGWAHGMIPFVILEIWSFPYFTKAQFSFNPNASFESHLPVVGLTILLGQISLVISILHKKHIIKLTTQIAGFVLLWLSIVYFNLNINKETGVFFATITCLPFAICTTIAFEGKAIKRVYDLILE